jgi:hypothetical protein
MKEKLFTQRRKDKTEGAKGGSLCVLCFSFAPLREIFFTP